MKKFTAFLLIFSLMMLSTNLYAKKRGAKLIVTKTDGQKIRGELITVKPNSLLLLDTEGKDVSIDIADIKVITIVKKSKVLLGAGIGLLIGAGGGVLLGHAMGDPEYLSVGWDFSLTAKQKAFIFGIAFGVLGLLLGGIFGKYHKKYKTIQIEGMTDLEIQETMDKLRKKARIREYK